MEKFLIDNFFDLSEYPHKGVFEACVYPWEALGHLERFFSECSLGKIACEIPEGVHLVHPELITIGEGTVIEPGAYIRGPCVIGRECQVRQGAYLRGYVLAGDRCILGHCSEFKGSILLNGACAAHFNYVGDSILGNRVNLGAGVKLANLRLDGVGVHIHANGQKIPTHLKKMGAIVGDDSQIGCNAVANPGAVLGKGVQCYPCQTVSNYIPPNSKITSQGELKLCR